MISIVLNDSELDLFEDTEVVWNWRSFRFQTEIRDAYTNNFSIPKTEKNIQILGVYSLFDQSDIQFPGRLQPAMLNLNAQIMPIYIQVVSINEKEIEICIFEDKLVYTLKGTKFQNIKDTPDTIFPWNRYSHQLYSNAFKMYSYGTEFNPLYQNIHGSIKLNDIIDRIGEQHNVSIQHFSDLWRIICTKKYVCPENPIQVLEFSTTKKLDNDQFTIYGGQHITNDCNFSGSTSIKFNRRTVVQMKIRTYFYKKLSHNNNSLVYVCKNGSPYLSMVIMHSDTYISKTEYNTLTASFDEGDVLTFECSDSDKFKIISLVVKMTHSNYEITEEDYNEEMTYKGRLPRLKVLTNTGYTYIPFDGSYNEYYNVQTEPLTFCYFGLWCNLPQINIGEFLYSMQYISNSRCIQRGDSIFFENYEERSDNVEGNITSMKFHSSEVGKKNYIMFSGDKDKQQQPVVEFENEWLVNEKVWSKNIFKYFTGLRIPQYNLVMNVTDPEWDSELGWEPWLENVFQYDYNDFDEPVLLLFVNPNNNQKPRLSKFGMDRINNCKEVSITLKDCPPNITELDTVFLDGHEYYIIEGETNFKTGQTTIKALLLT